MSKSLTRRQKKKLDKILTEVLLEIDININVSGYIYLEQKSEVEKIKKWENNIHNARLAYLNKQNYKKAIDILRNIISEKPEKPEKSYYKILSKIIYLQLAMLRDENFYGMKFELGNITPDQEIIDDKKEKKKYKNSIIIKSLVIYSLLYAMSDKDVRVRTNSAEALGKIKDIKAIEKLLEILASDNNDILGLNKEYFELNSTSFHNVRNNAAIAIYKIAEGFEIPEKKLDRIIDRIKVQIEKEDDWAVVVSLCEGLVRLDKYRAIKLLRPLVDYHEKIQVRRAAAFKLASIPISDNIKNLIYLLKNNPYWEVRSLAAQNLGYQSKKLVVKELETTLIKENSAHVVKAILWALGECGDEDSLILILQYRLKFIKLGLKKEMFNTLSKLGFNYDNDKELIDLYSKTIEKKSIQDKIRNQDEINENDIIDEKIDDEKIDDKKIVEDKINKEDPKDSRRMIKKINLKIKANQIK